MYLIKDIHDALIALLSIPVLLTKNNQYNHAKNTKQTFKKCITGEQLIQRKLRIWVKLAITLYSNVHFQWIIKHFHKILRSTTLSDIYNNIKSCRSDWKQISVIVFVHYLSNINLFYFIFHFSFITLFTLEYWLLYT